MSMHVTDGTMSWERTKDSRLFPNQGEFQNLMDFIGEVFF